MMTDGQVLLAKSIDDFFHRSGLTAQDQLDCFKYVEELYPYSSVYPSPSQGYCSLTVFVDNDKVVQFRPYGYRLDLRITQTARDIYGSFAPDTKYIGTIPRSGLLVYGMGRIEGVSFRDLRDEGIVSSEQRATLCIDFAVFLSKAWNQSDKGRVVLGLVGNSIRSRLKSLCNNLPPRFRATASYIAQNIHLVEALPWVLNHGDIVAANIMVQPSSGHLLGFVDWAEAETLPFGTCLYGLEELLGQMTPNGFVYHPDASDLRDIFWAALVEKLPELQQSSTLEAVKLARDLGVLLWHGIAFDNGAIDRVVEDGKDVEEIRRLDAFLEVPQPEKAKI
jgi:hypothetical protein